MSDLITDIDKRMVRNGYTDATLGPTMRDSAPFQRAEARLATKSIFWSPTAEDFVHNEP